MECLKKIMTLWLYEKQGESVGFPLGQNLEKMHCYLACSILIMIHGILMLVVTLSVLDNKPTVVVFKIGRRQSNIEAS